MQRSECYHERAGERAGERVSERAGERVSERSKLKAIIERVSQFEAMVDGFPFIRTVNVLVLIC